MTKTLHQCAILAYSLSSKQVEPIEYSWKKENDIRFYCENIPKCSLNLAVDIIECLYKTA